MANTKTLREIIREMSTKSQITIREKEPLSWGTKDECRVLFERIFRELDTTMSQFQFLPEYEQIIDWMTDTQDKGLLLMGDCGRGKSIIITGVIPVLFRLKERIVKPMLAQDINRVVSYDPFFMNCPPNFTYLDFVTSNRIKNIVLDEIGTETMRNDYGEKVESFNVIMNLAEQYHKRLFLSTNLTESEILDRYGMRTLDRLSHLCRIVRFSGESLR